MTLRKILAAVTLSAAVSCHPVPTYAADFLGGTKPTAGRVHKLAPGSWHIGQRGDRDRGNPVRAWRSGRVEYVGAWGSIGRYVFVRHGDVETGYAHLARISVREGQRIRRGQLVGRVGESGDVRSPVLHFIRRGR